MSQIHERGEHELVTAEMRRRKKIAHRPVTSYSYASFCRFYRRKRVVFDHDPIQEILQATLSH